MLRIAQRLRPSPSMTVAFVALLIALGGTSYAVTRLPARSVGAKQLKRDAVTRVHIQRNAVDGSKVADDALTGADISEETLAKVPSALSADRAGSAGSAVTAGSAGSALRSDRATSSGALDAVFYRSAKGTVPAAPSADAIATAGASASCDAGQHVVGGGVKLEDIEHTSVVDTFPDAGGTVWTAEVDSSDPAGVHGFTVYAVCVVSATAG